MTEGKKRKLIIKDCKIDDTANITIKVPGDESSAPLKVARKSTTNIWIIMLQNPSRISLKRHLEEAFHYFVWRNFYPLWALGYPLKRPFPFSLQQLFFLSQNSTFLLHSECTTGAEYLFSIYTLTPHPK